MLFADSCLRCEPPYANPFVLCYHADNVTQYATKRMLGLLPIIQGAKRPLPRAGRATASVPRVPTAGTEDYPSALLLLSALRVLPAAVHAACHYFRQRAAMSCLPALAAPFFVHVRLREALLLLALFG